MQRELVISPIWGAACSFHFYFCPLVEDVMEVTLDACLLYVSCNFFYCGLSAFYRRLI